MKKYFERIFRTLRLVRYKQLFKNINEKQGSLNATEAFSVEIIYLLKNPTINEFADFLSISQPNASYKVSSLVSKGYLTKTPCLRDRREFKLKVTDKFREYYGKLNPAWVDSVKRVESGYSKDELKLIKGFLAKVSDETRKLENQPL